MCTNLSDDQCAIGLHKNVCVSAACSKQKLGKIRTRSSGRNVEISVGILWFPFWFKVAVVPLQCKVKTEGWCGQGSKAVLDGISLYWCALLMETTARARRASLIDSVILGKMHGSGWHKKDLPHPILGRVSDREASGGRGARGDKSLLSPIGKEWFHLQDDKLLVWISSKMQGLSLIIPFTCQQPLNLGHEQLEPLQNVYRMGTCGTGFLLLTRSVLGSFKSRRTFLSGAGCIYVLGCWEDGKGVDTILKTKMSPSDLLPLD